MNGYICCFRIYTSLFIYEKKNSFDCLSITFGSTLIQSVSQQLEFIGDLQQFLINCFFFFFNKSKIRLFSALLLAYLQLSNSF